MLVMISLLPIIEADDQPIKNNENNSLTTYEYLSENELIISFDLSEVIQTQIMTEKGEFTLLEVTGAGFIGAIGSPQLPAITQLYAVPTDQFSLEIIGTHIMESRHIDRIYPVQNPQSDSDTSEESVFMFDPSAYTQNVPLPEQLVEMVDTGNIRDMPFLKIRFCPIQYNSYQQIAVIYDTITIKLTFIPTEPVFVEPNYEQKHFYAFYENVFTNWPGFIEHTVFEQEVGTKDTGCDYLLITHQNYYTQAKELADWKHTKGLMAKTVNVSDIGTTYQQIRTYIQDAYDTWDPRPSYVLLFGDSEFVPTTYVNSAGTDLWYVTVDGSDYYPDMFIGRLPADDVSEAELMVQKTLTYEQTPPTLASFYENFVVAAYFQDDEDNGYETRRFVRTSEEIRDYLMSIGHTGERIYCTESSIDPTNYNNGYYGNGEPLPPELLRPTFAWDGDGNDIINALDQGIFILNHRDHGMISGWGDPYFTTSDFNSFSNGELLPVVFSINCLTGKFDNDECFCEEFLRKTDGGAIATFGASRISYSGYNDYLCRGFYDAMWPDFDPGVGDDTPLYPLGAVLNYGKAYMANTWGDPWGYEEYTFELFHCFGDPSLEIFSALPGTLDVTYTIMSDTIQVTVKGNGNPIEGSLVCISQEGGFYESGFTDASGIVQLDKTGASSEEELSLVATAHNYLYYSEQFMLNQKPDVPGSPTGPNEGAPNTEYMYKASTVDLDGDRILYMFSWGDETYSDWIGPFDSGDEAFAMHAWDEKGTYEVKVKAKDTNGDESDWSDPLAVSMPMNNAVSNPILLWIYNILINHFPIFGSVLQLLL